MSREVPGLAGRTAVATVSGAVVVAHGGRSVSTDPVTRVQPAVLRMVPFARAIRHALRGSGVAVYRPRFQLRGWNGELASPVADLREVLDRIGARFGPVPVVLVGHSMGARAALRAAGHPLVAAVAGLAPWLPSGEPVDQLAGRRILLAHGTADRVTARPTPGRTRNALNWSRRWQRSRCRAAITLCSAARHCGIAWRRTSAGARSACTARGR